MTPIEIFLFGGLVLIVVALTFLLGKALGRAQAVRLEIHPGEKRLEDQAKEDTKALRERVLKLTANVHLHLDDPTTFSDLVNFGDEDLDQDIDQEEDRTTEETLKEGESGGPNI